MAIAVHASSPAIVTGTGQGSLTTASFTPPAGSVLVAVAIGGWSGGTGTTTCAMSDSQSGSWTTGAQVNGGVTANNFGGIVKVSTRAISSSTSMTVTSSFTFGDATGGGKTLAVYVLTGASATVGATATLDMTTGANDISTSLTTTVSGSMIIGGVDENTSNLRTLAVKANTAFSSLSGTNPWQNATDLTATAILQGSALTTTLSTLNRGVTYGGSTAIGKLALVEIVPGTSSVTGADATTNIIDTATVAASVPAADTGSFADTAVTSQIASAADTGSFADTATKITVSGAADQISSTEAVKILSGGSTLAFGSDTVTAVENATVRVYDSDTVTSAEVGTAAVNGRLNPGSRIVRVAAEDRTDYVVR